MSETQFLILALVALVVTALTIKFIPRARQSPVFDRVLWGATWLLAFVGAWYVVGQIKTDAPFATMSWDTFAQIAGVTILLGALGGALALNVALWLIDRLNPPEEAENLEDARGEEEAPAPPEA